MSPADKFRNEVLRMLSIKGKLPKSKIEKLLEKPPENIGSDLALPCFALAKKNPVELAKELASKIKPSGIVKEVNFYGPYVNFYADWGKLGGLVMNQIIKEKDKYGSGSKTGKTVMVEHTSANPDGPLHLGHFRNSVIGDSLVRTFAFSGNVIKTDYILNDTGRQIAIAVMEYMKRKPKVKGKPDWWVLDLYVKGNKKVEKSKKLEERVKEIIQELESGNKELRRYFKFITQKCLDGHKETLGKLGIKVDKFSPESTYIFNNDMQKTLEKIKRCKETTVIGDRVWMDLKKFGIEREFNLTRSDGTAMYPLKDLTYHNYKLSNADFNVNVIGTDQKFYFKQIISALKLIMPKKADKYHVVFYEFLTLPEGTMSTRAGKFVSVDELIDKVVAAAGKTVHKKMPKYSKAVKDKIAMQVGIGALKYAMIKVSPEKTYSFSVKDCLSFDGDTAPYIQYSHARACSIMRKAGKSTAKPDLTMLGKKEEKVLISHLMEFPMTVSNATRDYRPHYVANYAYRLATLFNDFYQSVPVLKASDPKIIATRLILVNASRITLKNALGLLGIGAPDRM
jgi:arginyl-tRNA synthetase